jgi:arsenite methyltransferase
MTPRFVARQLSYPTGLLGRILAREMNRRNARMNAYAVEQLKLRDSDRVLEIGFGGGVNLGTLIARANFVAGMDPSRTMVDVARTKFSNPMRAGRADFRVGAVEAIPFEAGHFEKVCTVNTVYFWKSLSQGFAEIHRVLAPGGLIVVGFLPKEGMERMGMPADIFTCRTPDEVVDGLNQAGFMDVRVTRPDPSTAWNVMVATR